jgi:site-specific recombinase XerD
MGQSTALVRPPSRFHDLRHAAATFALSQGFTLEDVKQLLGHSSRADVGVLERRQGRW